MHMLLLYATTSIVGSIMGIVTYNVILIIL
jgi:hypothetical protein